MRNRKIDIEKYLRGELTPAEMHALEREALNDPFLAEALEGVEQAGADNFLYDLHKLNRSVHERSRKKSRKNNRDIRMWGWTSAVAATLLLIAVSGFIVVNLLRDQQARQQAIETSASDMTDTLRSSTDSLTVDGNGGALAMHDNTKDEASAEAKTPRVPQFKPKIDDPSVAEKAPKDDALQRADASPGKDTEGPTVIAEEELKAAEEEEKVRKEIESLARAEQATASAPVRTENADKTQQAPGAVRDRTAGAGAKRSAPGLAQSASVPRVVKGKVTDEGGQPLPGVNVIVRGTNGGTSTDAEGNYELQVADENAKLVFAFVGFETREVDAKAPTLNVTLEEDIQALSEVVVTGYGAETRSADAPSSFKVAEPDGGKTDFKTYLTGAIRYPQEAIKNKTEGKVTVRFTVEPTGELTDFEVIKGIGSGCEEELIRAIRQGPDWKPSTRDDRPVRDKVRVRYRFELPE